MEKRIVQKLSRVTGGKLRDAFNGVNVWIMHKPSSVDTLRF